MTVLVALLTFALGLAIASAAHSAREALRARQDAADARRAVQAAQERLVGAWKDGYAVPPAPQAALPAEEQTTPLLPALQSLVDDWDTPQAQAAQLTVIRERLQAGKTQMEVFNELMPMTAILPEVAVEGAVEPLA